jgi:hypothetical protein
MHPKQHVAITSAKSEAIMWNMANWSKQKVLNYIKEDVALRRVSLRKFYLKKTHFNINLIYSFRLHFRHKENTSLQAFSMSPYVYGIAVLLIYYGNYTLRHEYRISYLVLVMRLIMHVE